MNLTSTMRGDISPRDLTWDKLVNVGRSADSDCNVALSRVFISLRGLVTEEYKDPLLESTYSYNIERETSRQQKKKILGNVCRRKK